MDSEKIYLHRNIAGKFLCNSRDEFIEFKYTELTENFSTR